MRTAIYQEPRHHCKFHHLMRHQHRADLQSRLKSGHVSQVAPHHHLQYFSHVHVSTRYPTRQPEDSAAQYSHYTHVPHHCLTRLLVNSAERHFHCTSVSHHYLKRLPERHQMAPQGFPDLSASRRHLELVFRLTHLVLALREPVWPPKHLSGLQLQSLQLVVSAQHSVPMTLSLSICSTSFASKSIFRCSARSTRSR